MVAAIIVCTGRQWQAKSDCRNDVQEVRMRLNLRIVLCTAAPKHGGRHEGWNTFLGAGVFP